MVSCPRALRSASRRSRCPSKRALACLACSSFRVSSAESTVSSLFFQVAFVRPFAAEGASDVLYVCRSLLRQTVDDFLADYALVVGHSSLRGCWNSQTSCHPPEPSERVPKCPAQKHLRRKPIFNHFSTDGESFGFFYSIYFYSCKREYEVPAVLSLAQFASLDPSGYVPPYLA